MTTQFKHDWQLKESRGPVRLGVGHVQTEKTEECTVCGATRRFVKTSSGKWQRVDAGSYQMVETCPGKKKPVP